MINSEDETITFLKKAHALSEMNFEDRRHSNFLPSGSQLTALERNTCTDEILKKCVQLCYLGSAAILQASEYMHMCRSAENACPGVPVIQILLDGG